MLNTCISMWHQRYKKLRKTKAKILNFATRKKSPNKNTKATATSPENSLEKQKKECSFFLKNYELLI